LRVLLERYAELVDPQQSRGGLGSGERLPLMPATYTASVRELERLLRVMRDDRVNRVVGRGPDGRALTPRRLWWHVNAWFLAAETVTVRPPKVTRKNRGKQLRRQPLDEQGAPLPVYLDKRDGKTKRLVRVLRPAGADERIAELGVRYLASVWSAGFEPMLPDELRDAA
jgi:hypothetical protein